MAPQVCAPWLDPDSLCCSGATFVEPCDGSADVEQTYPFCDSDYVWAASNILFARTCFLYPGVCTASIWPCIDPCAINHYPCHTCCGPFQIELPIALGYTAFDVVITQTETIDGVPGAPVVIDPSRYRLERKRFVVFVDGTHFLRNNFGIGDGIETVISYSYGTAPPVELVMAAHDLACELKKACSGDGDCKLPPHVRAVSRQGLQIEMVDLQRMLMSDKTGIPSVDYALSVHGHCHGSLFADPAEGPLGWGPA